MKKKALIVLGPTATGKTDLAISLSKKLNGEIVSGDSRQVYKGLDIGTGKLPGIEISAKKGDGWWEMDGVRVWMLDVVDPKKRYSVFDYEKKARIVISDLVDRNKMPIIVGGTGLYLKSLTEGFDNLSIPFDQNLRKELEKLNLDELKDLLKDKSIEKLESLNNSDKNNPRRLIRAIELSMSSAGEIKKTDAILKDFDVLKIGLTTRREIISKRIRDRVLLRLDKGMIEEVRELKNNGLSDSRIKELGLEYSIISDFLKGTIKDREELIKILKTKIGQYAKRQMTWFKRDKEVVWFDITEIDFGNKVEKQVVDWYNSTNV